MKIRFALISIFFLQFSYAQEVVIPTNTVSGQNFVKGNQSEDTLKLPFWDDFSETQIAPSADRWSDANVYINSSFTERMPSVGIATFDAVDAVGNFYAGADYENSFEADVLTSKPINMNLPGNTTVWFSFYYRPQGYGDAPEPQDSLVLQFLAEETQTWHSVWSVEGSYDTEFQQVMIHVTDEKFLKDGFRFRFKNYASPGSSMYADLAGNCDFWHIDYILLDKNRTETKTYNNDISISKTITSLLKDYESVPWKHFQNVEIEKITTFKVAFQNHQNINRSIDSLNFYSKHIESGTELKLVAGAKNINAFSYLKPSDLSNMFDFQQNTDDSASFEIRAEIVTDDYDPTINNTTRYTQKFAKYYAYDDGTAEAAYGLYGTGTKYGMAAYRFVSLKPDSLEGVQMYFSRTLNDVSQKYFWLNFWYPNENGLPQDAVFQQIEGARPIYTENRNAFVYFKFEKPILVEDTFFVGWTQTTDEMLNVGFDWNRTANQHLFYNIGGSWIPSEIEGALMMRPVFKLSDIQPHTKKTNSENLSISPNPASEFIRIGNTELQTGTRIRIYNLQGMLMQESIFTTDTELSVTHLPAGIYILQTENGNNILRTKFVKQ